MEERRSSGTGSGCGKLRETRLPASGVGFTSRIFRRRKRGI